MTQDNARNLSNLYTEYLEIYRKSVLHLVKYRFAVYALNFLEAGRNPFPTLNFKKIRIYI